jgi:hypothetical protein
VSLTSPAHGSTLPLPVTFTWQKRGAAAETYGWTLFDVDDADIDWPTGDLGDVSQFTLTGLPEGTELAKEYRSFVEVYNGPDSFGSSYYYQRITFSSGDAVSPGGEALVYRGEVRREGQDLLKPRHPNAMAFKEPQPREHR